MSKSLKSCNRKNRPIVVSYFSVKVAAGKMSECTNLQTQLLRLQLRNILPQARPGSIPKGHHIFIHFLHFVLVAQPSFRAKDMRVLAKNGSIAMNDVRISAHLRLLRYPLAIDIQSAFRNISRHDHWRRRRKSQSLFDTSHEVWHIVSLIESRDGGGEFALLFEGIDFTNEVTVDTRVLAHVINKGADEGGGCIRGGDHEDEAFRFYLFDRDEGAVCVFGLQKTWRTVCK